MKYLISLIDDEGETLLAEETQIGEVAEKFLQQARMIEVTHPNLTAKFIRSTIKQWCPYCGEEMVQETLSTDLDGNRPEYGYQCPKGH